MANNSRLADQNLTTVQPHDHDRQQSFDDWGFLGPCRLSPPDDFFESHAQFYEMTVLFGFPDGIPYPPRGFHAWKRLPVDSLAMDVIRLSGAYTQAVANFSAERAWQIHQQIVGILEEVRQQGRDAERQERHALQVAAAKEFSEEIRKKADEARVYFIGGEDGAIKIGIAHDPEARLRGLQTSHHSKLAILATTSGGRRKELEYHKCFAAHRLEGEWFTPHPDILAEIDRLNSLGRASA